MSKVSVQAEGDIKTYLAEISKPKVAELEFFAQELNALIVRKKSKSKSYRVSQLYRLINETHLEADKQVIINTLAEKLQNGTMTDDENKVYQKLAKEEADIRNQRVAYMVELSQLRQIPFPQLMSELGLEPLPNG